MSLPTSEEILKIFEKRYEGLSNVLKVDDLVQAGVLARKKGTKTIYELLKPEKFPENAWVQVSEEIEIVGKQTIYIKFISEKQRIKQLSEVRRILDSYS